MMRGMIVSARERLILQYLIDEMNQEVTIKELAELLDVSERTIHRDLKNIEDVIQPFDVQLVKRSGIGIKLIGDKNHLHQLRVAIQKQDYTEYTPDERIMIILCTLLESQEPVKLFSLANDLGVTAATVSHDLDKIEPNIEKFGLTLVRRRGYGIELVGSEESKRKMIRSLISDRLDVQDFLKLLRENIQKKSTNTIDSISERLLGLVQKEKLVIIEHLIEEINSRLPYPLADSSYVGLVVHLALAMERIQRGEKITIKEEYLSQLRLTKEFQFAREIAHKLQEIFNQNIPEDEIGYITMHLRGAKIRFEQGVNVQEENVETAFIVNQLIKTVERLMGVPLRDDRSLFQGLLAHLQPTLYRLRQNMRISNPLLDQIKRDYKELFHTVKKAVSLTLPDMDVPDEEIGYLVLHFGSALNSQKIKNKIRVLIICSSGIGTSKMLATKIKNQIPGISELKSISAFELKKVNVEQYDLVLSTIPIEELPNEYLLVSPMLTEEEIDTIKKYIGKKGDYLAQPDSKEENTPSQYFIQFDDFKGFTEKSFELIHILESLDLYEIKEDTEIESILQSVCESLLQKGLIQSVNGVVTALKRREMLGGLGIPGTKLALYHAKSEHVIRPSFSVIDLKYPKFIKSMDQKTMKVERILLLLVPEEASSNILEIMSFISALIIQSEESIQVFETAIRNDLIQYITQHYFYNFVQKHKE